ncbi:hypothetical protein ZOSMA_483G00010 [Zostera marina]|uniref:Uncharacterized protein n=1 Tax=Zostera marina TaxID=29655 RepID=A0A0K9NZQ7_ZOSMR|nr:hypothetical protein ZOSMA_483G00010 [Zostera marina]
MLAKKRLKVRLKAKVWISKAANFRSSAWKVSNKRPG